MKNRWLVALIYTLIFLIVSHIVFFLIGFITKNDIGIFNLPMVWAHWSDSVVEAIIGLILSVAVYFIIYACFTRNLQNSNE